MVTGSRRGLTALGTGLLAVLAGGAGALVDTILFGELGVIFGVTFVFGCVFSAARVHADDLIGVVIMPPLAYAVIIIGTVFLQGSRSSGGGLRNNAIDVGSEMILRAPVLLVAFGIVVVIAVRRGQLAKASRRARRRQPGVAPTRPSNRRDPRR